MYLCACASVCVSLRVYAHVCAFPDHGKAPRGCRGKAWRRQSQREEVLSLGRAPYNSRPGARDSLSPRPLGAPSPGLCHSRKAAWRRQLTRWDSSSRSLRDLEQRVGWQLGRAPAAPPSGTSCRPGQAPCPGPPHSQALTGGTFVAEPGVGGPSSRGSDGPWGSMSFPARQWPA